MKLSLAAVAALTAALLPAGTAGAAPTSLTGTAACPAGYLCVWDQTNYQGNMYKFAGTNASWASWGINNNDASWYNHGTTGKWACVWSEENYWGSVKLIYSGTSSPSDSAHFHLGSSNSWDC